MKLPFIRVNPCPSVVKKFRVCIIPARGILRLQAAIFGFFAAQVFPASAQSWTTTTAPIANWVSVASSADGNRIAALIQGGQAVYISTNAGITWALSSPPNGGVQGSSIACSADGKILFVAGNTQISRSTNSGASWSVLTSSPIANWVTIACSADGSQVAGTMFLRRGSPVGIAISHDSGATWTTASVPNDPWTAIGSSASGSVLAAVDSTASAVYTSTDAGNTWSQRSPPLQVFNALASSADGARLFAAGGLVFASTNSGLNWTQTTATTSPWSTVACSADGQTVLAASGGQSFSGFLYLSTDAGATWTKTNVLLAHWTSVAISADGTKMAAAEYGGHIHTLHLSPVTLSPLLKMGISGGNLVISWPIPSMNFTLQQNNDLSTSNWTDMTAAPVLNMANLNNEVTVPSFGGNNFYRLTAGNGGAMSGTQAIANVLLGPWQTLVVDTLLTATFNADGTFTATIQPPAGAATTDSGTWTLTPPLVPSGFSNPSGHLTLSDLQNVILLSGDVLLVNPDQLLMTSASDNVSTTTFVPQLVISKVTP